MNISLEVQVQIAKTLYQDGCMIDAVEHLGKIRREMQSHKMNCTTIDILIPAIKQEIAQEIRKREPPERIKRPAVLAARKQA